MTFDCHSCGVACEPFGSSDLDPMAELDELLDESGSTEVNCPHCGYAQVVSSSAVWTFSVDVDETREWHEHDEPMRIWTDDVTWIAATGADELRAVHNSDAGTGAEFDEAWQQGDWRALGHDEVLSVGVDGATVTKAAAEWAQEHVGAPADLARMVDHIDNRSGL